MTLGELIAYLDKEDHAYIVPVGFHNPHSYRDFYHDVAFEPVHHISIGDMLASARSAVGTMYGGWKGGEFIMDTYTPVWLAVEGDSGESIGTILLDYMTGKYTC